MDQHFADVLADRERHNEDDSSTHHNHKGNSNHQQHQSDDVEAAALDRESEVTEKNTPITKTTAEAAVAAPRPSHRRHGHDRLGAQSVGVELAERPIDWGKFTSWLKSFLEKEGEELIWRMKGVLWTAAAPGQGHGGSGATTTWGWGAGRRTVVQVRTALFVHTLQSVGEWVTARMCFTECMEGGTRPRIPLLPVQIAQLIACHGGPVDEESVSNRRQDKCHASHHSWLNVLPDHGILSLVHERNTSAFRTLVSFVPSQAWFISVLHHRSRLRVFVDPHVSSFFHAFLGSSTKGLYGHFESEVSDWPPEATRLSRMVFIGDLSPRVQEALRAGVRSCIAAPRARPPPPKPRVQRPSARRDGGGGGGGGAFASRLGSVKFGGGGGDDLFL